MSAPVSSPLLIVISAPSGAEKTTLCDQVLARWPNVNRAITCTTRPPRGGEREGVDYYFLDVQTFVRRVEEGDFLEHALVHGNRYGVLKSEVLGRLRAGHDVLANVDVQGAASIRAAAQQDGELRRALVSVFLTVPSIATLEERLRKRGTDSDEVIQKRLGVARQEIAQSKHFDYLIVSSTIAEDYRRMEVILQAEKMRQGRVPLPEGM